MNASELLHANSIRLPGYSPGRYYTLCPRCSHTRTPTNRKAKVLGVTIDQDGSVRWGCNHCNWTGPEANGGNPPPRITPGAVHHSYISEDGTPLRKVRRPKGTVPRCTWQHLDASGEWKAGTDRHTPRIYRHDQIKSAIAEGRKILVAEGESDVDCLWRYGFAATCSPHGAAEPGQKSKWLHQYSEQLRGANLIVLNDNDPQGYDHAEATCKMSAGTAQSIRRLDLKPHWPDIGAGDDVRAWLESGTGSQAKLERLIAEAPIWKKNKTDPTRLKLNNSWKMLMPQSMGTIVHGLLHAGSLTLVYGPPKSGKSFLLTSLFLAIAAGDEEWMGHPILNPGPVLYIACEGHAGFWKRLKAAAINRGWTEQTFPSSFVLGTGRPHLITISNNGHAVVPSPQQVTDAIDEATEMGCKPVAIAIDTIFRSFGGGNVNASDHMNAYLAAVATIMDRNIAVAAVHHETKQGGTPAGSVTLIGGADTLINTATLEDGNHSWQVEMAKDDATTEAQKFTLKIVPVGEDADGNEASSCVVETASGPVPRKIRKMSDAHADFYSHLKAIIAEHGELGRPLPTMPTVRCIFRAALRKHLAIRGYLIEGSFAEREGEVVLDKNALTKENNALTALKLRGILMFNRISVWLL